MEITELDELSKLQLDPTRHFELIRVVQLASTRLDLAATLKAAEDVPVFESPPLRTVRPSAPPDSGITLNPQPAADIGHAATPYGYSGGLTKFKLNSK